MSDRDFGNGAVVVDEPLDQVARVTLNRPDRRNAMNADLLGGLYDAFDALRHDRACRVIVLTGAGTGFCAGLDLAEGVKLPDLAEMGRARAGMRVQQYIANLIPLMRAQPQPIIAAVNGAASGGGLALTLGSDIRIAAAERALQRRVHQGRPVRVRHRDELDPAAPHRRVAGVRAHAHRPLRRQ